MRCENRRHVNLKNLTNSEAGKEPSQSNFCIPPCKYIELLLAGIQILQQDTGAWVTKDKEAHVLRLSFMKSTEVGQGRRHECAESHNAYLCQIYILLEGRNLLWLVYMNFSSSVIVLSGLCVVWVRGMSQMARRLSSLPREKKIAALQGCKSGLPRDRHDSGKAARRGHETSSAAAGLGRLKGLPTTDDYCVKGIRKVIKCHNLYCEPRQSHIVNVVDLEIVS